jgi:DNA-binding response OmpR family regulator
MANILVVDDEMGIRALLQEILTDEGHSVELAENAAQARLLRERQRPDLVLLDIWMPDVDGISLLKEWHAGGHLNMPVVMMSGHGTIDTAVEATRFGAFDFLEKPIALQKLLSTVQKALKHEAPLQRPPLTLEAFTRSAFVKEFKRRFEQAAAGEGFKGQRWPLQRRLVLERLLHRRQQLLQRDRLFQEIEGAEARRLDRGVDRAVSRHHHHRHVQVPAGVPLLEQRDAVHVGHPDVQQHEVGALALAQQPRLRGVLRQLDAVTFVGQDFLQEGSDAHFVIDDKNVGHE